MADAFKDSLNNNPNYKESAIDWEGALIIEFKSEDERLTHDAFLWLDLHHGVCRGARFLDNKDDAAHDYVISASEIYWYDLINGKVAPAGALMSGKIKIEGNMSKLMRYMKAAAYIFKYLKRHLKNW